MTEALTPTDIFKCLADETRVRMVLLIEREQELCVCELTCAMDESQPKISRHLALLRIVGRSPARPVGLLPPASAVARLGTGSPRAHG